MSDPWQKVFVHSTDAIFLLNRQKRLLFVNPAWETLTGLSAHEVLGVTCRRRPRTAASTLLEEIQSILAPPREILHGGPAVEHRRLAPHALPAHSTAGVSGEAARWWDVSFWPMSDSKGVSCIVGKITVVAAAGLLTEQPLPENIVAVRQRFYEHFVLDDDSGSPEIQRVREQVSLAAQTRSPVVMVGETGTGKHWHARIIHRHSDRRELPFVRLDCGRLPRLVLAEGVFGTHGLLRRHASGTVYLRDPAALPREMQATLAVMLENSGEAGPRFITGFCGNQDGIAIDLKRGRLLPELFAALGPIVIQLPPLRQRLGDIQRLAEHFLQRCGSELPLAADALQTLNAHAWPGNLHELQRVLAGAARTATGERLEANDLPFYLRATPLPVERKLPLDAILEQVERRLLIVALRLAQDNKTRAAEILSIWRPRLLRRMQALGFANAVDDDEPNA